MPTTMTHAVFETAELASAALDRLAAEGVAPTDIEVRSSIPLHGVAPRGSVTKSRVPLMAVLGGLAGGTGAYLLASLTAQAYPLPTGGMPIVALPPIGVITFEGTAIGAILCTVLTVLVECGLPAFRRRPGPLDAYVAAGHVLVTAKVDSGAWAEGASATATSTV